VWIWRHEVEISRAVASDQQEGILSGTGLPAVSGLWRDDDVITDLETVPLLPQNVGDLAPQYDCILSV
jgi:hypothetical protein